MQCDPKLTQGGIAGTLVRFAGPMIAGNLLQQCYNIADMWIVGRVVGADALAAVGAAYSLMTFLTSITIGLCMGSGTVFSVCFGKADLARLKSSMTASFGVIAAISILLTAAALLLTDPILHLLNVPQEIFRPMREYVRIGFCGIIFVFLYNYASFLLRAAGDSATPLRFLGGAALANIALDVLLVVAAKQGIRGAAWATVAAQALSGVGLLAYIWMRMPDLRPQRADWRIEKRTVRQVTRHSVAACVQQSVMNFGILLVQGLVNSFGVAVMAAFAAAVKIDSIAYMPAQEFGNAFSLFVSQNHGGGRRERVREGLRQAMKISTLFCAAVSAAVFLFAPHLMRIFVDAGDPEIIRIGTEYLRIEGSCYCGIGLLFLLYGFYRGVERPEFALVLTVISLGTRVLLAYRLAAVPWIGAKGIWWAIPIGWVLADLAGLLCLPTVRALKNGRN